MIEDDVDDYKFLVGSDCGRDPRAVLGVERVVDDGPVSKKTIHFKGSPFLLQIMFNEN